MISNLPPFFLLTIIITFFSVNFPNSSAQQQPQNLQAIYPFPLTPPPSPPQNPPPLSPNVPVAPAPLLPPPALPFPTPSVTNSPGSSKKKAVGTAIGVTAASTLVVSALLFFFIHRYSRRRRKEGSTVNPYAGNPQGGSPMLSPDEFVRVNGGNLKGVIMDEDGLDVLYWRKLQGQDGKEGFFKKSFKNIRHEEEKEEEKQMIAGGGDRNRTSKKPVHEMPLLRGKSSTSQSPIWSGLETSDENQTASFKPMQKLSSSRQFDSDEIQLSRTSASFKAMETSSSSRKFDTIAPSLVVPPVPLRAPPPPPPPAPALASAAVSKGPSAPPPPPLPNMPKKGPPPPPLPKAISLSSPARPPAVPKGQSSGEGEGQVKLKPLHWDKVNPNVEHSMVWDKIDGGSFKFDDDLMEALFGYVATKRKSPRDDAKGSVFKGDTSGPPSQIFILDTRKSQNIAIVLKSLGLSRNDIIDALIQGDGLNVDTLEKLSKIAPTVEEESAILAFDGDPTRLADAESFLYHLLKAVPSAFPRFNALLFRSNYNLEMLHLKESFQTLEHGCQELRNRGLLLKLLEAILKAGNRMNAGTSRGNAQAFKLTALRKLSDVKSTDGKTTLLHFVVEEVVRAEGKRCVVNRNRGLSRSNSNNSFAGGSTPESSLSREEREREYIKLGLPLVGGLSSEFTSVKKAAGIDYDGLEKSCTVLANQIAEYRKLVPRSETRNEGFVKEMRTFLNAADRETRILREEQSRVMDLVSRTTEYYQPGASKDNGWQPLQIFVIVKDFLGMVDQACIDITRNLQKRKPMSTATGNSGSSSPPGSPKSRPSVRFPKLPANFMMSDKSSDSDDGS